MQKKWILLPSDGTKNNELFKQLNIHPSICNILVQRGIDTFEKAKSFFRPSLSELHSPWLMKGMNEAVDRILKAFSTKEKILIYGDYDVDGTTSVASLFQFIQKLHPYIEYYIPHRYKEGYGLSKAGIQYAVDNDFSLIITLDCGIKSTELVHLAKSNNIDVIICDHHLPDAQLPDAVAILNPKQPDCPYPYKDLCGCGVGFKLMMALTEKLELPEESYLKFIDLVATAIAADIVPITGENRILAFKGVEKANSNPSIGIAALLHLSGNKQRVNINSLVFLIAPRINAAGRMDDAKKAVQLFVEQDFNGAIKIAEQLQNDNTERKEADSSITEEALAELNNNPDHKLKKTTVLFKAHWHKGVVGIVASRLTDYFYRPTVILTKSGDVISGSARSVPGFNVYEAIHACRAHLTGYGGHFAAAGLTMHPHELNNFCSAFETAVASTITSDLLVPQIVIDTEIPFSVISKGYFNLLSQMEPFGPDNMRPIFISKGVTDSGNTKIVKEKHIRFSLTQNGFTLDGIGFGLAEKFEIVKNAKALDVVYSLDLNEFNGNNFIQLKVIDIQPSK